MKRSLKEVLTFAGMIFACILLIILFSIFA